MPESPETNLGKLKIEAEKTIKGLGGQLHSTENEEIAFGLKALILTLLWPENKGSDELEKKLAKIKGVNSVNVIDVRRAIG